KDSILKAGNPVKEILLKLNLPDHMSILTDSKIHIKMEMEVPGSADSMIHSHVLTLDRKNKDIMKAQVTSTQDGKRSEDDDKRLCLVDDLKRLKITYKSKFTFVDETCLRESFATSDVLTAQRDRCNVVILTWILNSVSQDVYMGLIYFVNVASVWKHLEGTYDNVDGLKKVANPIKQSSFIQNFNANVDVKTNEKQQTAPSLSSSSSFTAEQMKKLLSLINETPYESIYANMTVVPSFCSILYVNKLIKDNKLFVVFNKVKVRTPSRVSKFPAKLNDYVIDSKDKLDVNNNFLYGDLVEDVYMSLPLAYSDDNYVAITEGGTTHAEFHAAAHEVPSVSNLESNRQINY
nr:ribonuclease H-like domain-containing protein [Tanacetum cinerariifolium]